MYIGGKLPSNGDKVFVNYKGYLDDGTVFDGTETEGREPLSFIIGTQSVIPGFESAIKDMEVGEKKTVVIAAADAYGEWDENLIIEIPQEQFQVNDMLPVGHFIELDTPMGTTILVKIVSVEDGVVKLDRNSRLAGKDLTFDLELVEVQTLGK